MKARFDLGAFGETLATSFDNVPGGMLYGWIGSLGDRYDPETQLHYMRQRWYDPTLQRFISRDPIGLKGGNNLYAYVANSPTNLVDPSGLQGFLGAAGQLLNDFASTPMAQTLGRMAAGAPGFAANLAKASPIGILEGTALKGMAYAGSLPRTYDRGAVRFPDEMGSDRGGNVQYDMRSDGYNWDDAENAPRPPEVKVGPYTRQAKPPRKEGRGGEPRTSEPPNQKKDCSAKFQDCLKNYQNALGTLTPSQIYVVEYILCSQTERSCRDACGGEPYIVSSRYWPKD